MAGTACNKSKRANDERKRGRIARMATPADRVQFVRPYKKQKKRERIGVVEYRVECVCVCVQENEGPKRCSPMKNRSTVSADTEANTDNCGPNYPHNCSLFAFTYSLSLSLSFSPSSPPLRIQFARNPTFGPRQSFATVRETTLHKVLKTLVIRFIILTNIKYCYVN